MQIAGLKTQTKEVTTGIRRKYSSYYRYGDFKIEVFGKRVDGLVKDVSKATIIMEYPLLSLKREFHNRLLNKADFQID